MRTRVNKHGTQDERRAESTAKLLDATIALIGEHGPLGFSLEQVGDRAKVSRSLARHHFGSRDALLKAAVERAVAHAAPTGHDELGLPGLLEWMRHEVGKGESGDPARRCLLTLKVAPCPADLDGLVAQHTEAQVVHARRHLERARGLRQVRSDIVAKVTASLLIAQLQGELLRLAAGGVAMSAAFIDLMRQALIPLPRAGSQSAAPPKEPPSKPKQPDLF